MAPKKSSNAAAVKSRSPSPAKTTRSSARAATPSTKAKESGASATRSKSTSPGRKASPGRKGKATQDDAAYTPEAGKPVNQVFFARANQAIEDLEGGALDQNGAFDPEQVVQAWQALKHWPQLDGYARKGDDANTKDARPLYRKVKKILRPYFGDAYDEMLTRHVSGAEVYDLIDAQHDATVLPSIEDEPAQPSRGRRQASNTATRFARTASVSPSKTTAGRVAKPSAAGRSRSISPSKATQRSTSATRLPVPRSGSPHKGFQSEYLKSLRERSMSPAKRGFGPAAPRGPGEMDIGRTRPRAPAPQTVYDEMDIDMGYDDDGGPEPGMLDPRMPDDDFGTRTRRGGATSRTTSRTRAAAQTAASPDFSPPSSEDMPPPLPTTISTEFGDMDLDPLANTGSGKGSSYFAREPSASDRGKVVSHTNPERITVLGTERPNPFFETMPAPEVWHRRMPPYFPFGETPYMEARMSGQIDEDLRRGLEDAKSRRASNATFAQRITNFVGGILTSPVKPAPARKIYPSPWDLPTVSEAEIRAAMGRPESSAGSRVSSLGKRRTDDVDFSVGPTPAKRPYRGPRSVSASRRTMMSGGLGSFEGPH